MMYSCYQSNFITILHALFNGITLEGGSHYGYDPVWEKNTEPSATTKAAKEDQLMSQARFHNYMKNLQASKKSKSSDLQYQYQFVETPDTSLIFTSDKVQLLQEGNCNGTINRASLMVWDLSLSSQLISFINFQNFT